MTRSQARGWHYVTKIGGHANGKSSSGEGLSRSRRGSVGCLLPSPTEPRGTETHVTAWTRQGSLPKCGCERPQTGLEGEGSFYCFSWGGWGGALPRGTPNLRQGWVCPQRARRARGSFQKGPSLLRSTVRVQAAAPAPRRGTIGGMCWC